MASLILTTELPKEKGAGMPGGMPDARMHKYEIIIYWSTKDQVFVAEVPELPGYMAHGDTQELALANAKEAIQLWIDTARETGRPAPTPKGQRLMYA